MYLTICSVFWCLYFCFLGYVLSTLGRPSQFVVLLPAEHNAFSHNLLMKMTWHREQHGLRKSKGGEVWYMSRDWVPTTGPKYIAHPRGRVYLLLKCPQSSRRHMKFIHWTALVFSEGWGQDVAMMDLYHNPTTPWDIIIHNAPMSPPAVYQAW